MRIQETLRDKLYVAMSTRISNNCRTTMAGSTLQESFIALKEYFVGSNHGHDTANPAQLVLFAENAFKEKCTSVASECLELYFSLDPPTNQFLIRAYLCQALTASTSPAEPEERLQKSVDCIVAAVDIAKKSECYHFLVHNASVLMWQICRPYRKHGWSGLCLNGWQSVGWAQELCKTEDHEWRLDILMALLESQVDTGLNEEARKTCLTALQLAHKRVPGRLLQVLKLSMFYGLGDGKAVGKEMKSVPEFNIFSKLYKLKRSLFLSALKQSDVELELRKLVNAILEVRSTNRKTPSSSKQPQPLSLDSKATLLIEVAQICVEQGLVELCDECLASLPAEAQDARLDLFRRTETSQLTLLKSQQLSPYSRTAVEIREQSIGQLENCIIAAQRMGDQEIVQHVGAILWGVCLPLLQPNLRTRLSHTLKTLASALEQVDSLLYGERCSIHIELAKVCADQNQLETALEHINKAQELDSECEWSEQLKWFRERLQLRSELYVTPSSPLQQATQILEQVKSCSDSGSKDELRAVLVKVGALLAPNHFRIAIGDKEAEPAIQQVKTDDVKQQGMKEESTVKEDEGNEGLKDGGEGQKTKEGIMSSVSGDSEYPGLKEVRDGSEGEEVKKDDRMKSDETFYEVAKEQVLAHKEKVGTENDAERCKLWADLAKLSRKHEVWDVAYVASKFCLIYDDKRWIVQAVKIDEQPSKTNSKKKLQKSSSLSVNRSRSNPSARTLSNTATLTSAGPAEEREAGRKRGRERVCKDLVRTLAETHFIHAECAVYQLKESGHELGHGIRISPEEQKPQLEQTVESNILVLWPGQLSSDAYASFLRAAELGCSLCEAWLVASAATYLCNYSHHLLQTNSLTVLVPVFRPLLASVLAVREHDSHTIEGDVVCRLSAILAGGLVQKWIPLPPDSTKLNTSDSKSGRKSGRGTAAAGKKKGGGGGDIQLQVSPDADPELKEALEVCERGLGSKSTLTVRANLLAVWVQCKQLLQQSIPVKTLGIEKHQTDGDSDIVGCCRAVVAVETLGLMGNRIWDFPDCPTLSDAFDLVSNSEWNNNVMLELELLTRIARQALLQTNYSLVSKCTNKALLSVKRCSDPMKDKKTKKDMSEVHRRNELLSCITSLHGQGLVAGGEGKVASARAAMEVFVQSATYGKDAGSYGRVLEASQHYWNVCRELMSSPLDREALQQPLTVLISILTSFLPKRSAQTSVEQKEEDLKLYVAMYNIVFQVYIDKGEWEEGLETIEEAMWVTPRTIHRDLIELKLVFKSQMGKNVAGDMIRFQDSREEERARMWYKAACNSSNPQQQLTAFQNSINTIMDPINMWLRVDYILALSEWLYTHQFPVEEALSHLKWALNLLVGNGEDHDKKKKDEEGKEESDEEVKCRVFEKAMCVLVMMTQLHGRGSPGHKECCLAALAYCNLIWKATLESYSHSVSGKCDVQLPTSVQEWIDFAATDGLKDYIKSGNSESSITIRAPALTCHYFGLLSDELCACCLHPLAIPVENLRLLVTDCLLSSLPTSQLIHLRLVKLYAALGAKTASEEHLKKAGPVYLNPEDLATSHAEIGQYHQKKEMVQREESKKTNYNPETVKKSHPFPTPASCPPLIMTERPVLRQVWTEEAAILIKQGQLHVSRELLQEVKISAQVFDDGHEMGRMLITQASLAATEKRVEECIHCVCEAQKYPLCLNLWEEGMSLLLTVGTSQGTSYRDSCIAVVSDAVSSLKSVLLERNSNERARVEVVEAILCSRLANIRAEVLLDRTDGSMDELEQLSEEMTVHTQNLLRLGRCDAAAQVMLDHARVMRRYSNIAQNMSHRINLLKAVELLQEAVDTVQSVLEDALSLCSLSDGSYLPEERLLVEAELELADTLLQVANEHFVEEREKRNRQQQKSCIEKMIDEYVQVSPQYSSIEEAWNTVASIAADRALAALTSIYECSTVQSQKQLIAKCVYSIGRALLLLSEHASPDGLLQWKKGSYSDRTTQAVTANDGDTTEGDNSTTAKQLNQHSTLSQVMRGEEASTAEIAESESIQFLTKASQSLGQALNLALHCEDKEIAAMAALKIADSCGTCSPETSALHLTLYQSCVTSQNLLRLLFQVQSDPSESKLASLLHQHKQLTLSSPPALVEAVTTELNTYTCWQMLQVNEHHLDMLKYFPPHFRFIVLQHSEDKSQLYSAYLIPPQPPLPASKKGQPPPIAVSEVSVVTCVDVSAQDRDRVVELVNSSKRLQAQQLLKSLGDSPSTVMNQQFRSGMERYLSSALDPIAVALKEEKNESELTVIFLADLDLLQLPLEALNVLQSECVKAVARDFSLQMLCHRINKFIVQDEDAGTKKKDKFQLQPSFLQANTTSFQYILDPRSELNREKEKLLEKIVSQINAFPKITSKWNGHKGGNIEDAMSSSQWYPILKQCSGLLFFGSERFLAHFPPRQLVSLSMQDCSLAIVMDHMQTPASSLTQSRLDIQKIADELNTENSLHAAALLSLVGVGCLITRQWHSTVDTCIDTMCSYIKQLLSEGVGIAHVMWKETKQSNTQQHKQSEENISDDAQSIKTAEQNPQAFAFNSIVYGLPHLALNLPNP